MNRKQLAVAAILVLLVIASNWLFRQQDKLPLPFVAQQPGPDAFAENIHLEIMDKTGHPLYRLRAADMEYYPEDDRLQLQHPLLDITRANGANWQVSAESGHTSASGEPVWLLGKVNIQRLASDAYKSLQIVTEDLLIQPSAALAETENAASITGSGFRLEAVGLDADLGNNRLKLHSRVRGQLNDAS
ncbi:MAG: LPS export ABC transporter periplasmic protein LptC [Gammaproteobacteria bacterium]|nr:LPS export ABC transporter periplasmic protein LptC [Gammaproteobacteria bacterium]